MRIGLVDPLDRQTIHNIVHDIKGADDLINLEGKLNDDDLTNYMTSWVSSRRQSARAYRPFALSAPEYTPPQRGFA
jgi:hypothetical protein